VTHPHWTSSKPSLILDLKESGWYKHRYALFHLLTLGMQLHGMIELAHKHNTHYILLSRCSLNSQCEIVQQQQQRQE
jgi:hypothetical protein